MFRVFNITYIHIYHNYGELHFSPGPRNISQSSAITPINKEFIKEDTDIISALHCIKDHYMNSEVFSLLTHKVSHFIMKFIMVQLITWLEDIFMARSNVNLECCLTVTTKIRTCNFKHHWIIRHNTLSDTEEAVHVRNIIQELDSMTAVPIIRWLWKW